MRPLDLLIAGGTIVDGTGAPRFTGAIGLETLDGAEPTLVVIRDQAAIAAATGAAHRVIDATDKVVAPGFIDLHSHSGLMILANPVHEPKVRQGVTTEVIGVDGLSYAPIADPARLAELVEMNAGLDGHPEIDYDWDTVESYLGQFDGAVGPNIAFVVGNSALRLSAIGWDELEADGNAVRSMRSMLAEAMHEGAFGLSSGL